jgi:hypothetical protein
MLALQGLCAEYHDECLDYDVLKCGGMLCRYIPTFWRNLLPPSSGEKMEEASSSEMLIPIYQATQYHVPEGFHLN